MFRKWRTSRKSIQPDSKIRVASRVLALTREIFSDTIWHYLALTDDCTKNILRCRSIAPNTQSRNRDDPRDARGSLILPKYHKYPRQETRNCRNHVSSLRSWPVSTNPARGSRALPPEVFEQLTYLPAFSAPVESQHARW
jgi:hypothetical protein